MILAGIGGVQSIHRRGNPNRPDWVSYEMKAATERRIAWAISVTIILLSAIAGVWIGRIIRG
jgi:hypothetical protein